MLQQPTVQEQGHMALPGQQGHIGPEVIDSNHNDPPAPVDEDNTKPMWRTWQDDTNRNQFYLKKKVSNFLGGVSKSGFLSADSTNWSCIWLKYDSEQEEANHLYLQQSYNSLNSDNNVNPYDSDSILEVSALSWPFCLHC